MGLADYILAYRAVKEQRAREKAYRELIGKDPDWKILQELIDRARTDVIATITFPNGTRLDLHKRDAFDAMQMMDPERKAAY